MRSPRQLRQNLFLHFAEPRLWLKLLQLTVKVRSFEGRPVATPAAFRWVWHFLKDSLSALCSAVDLKDSGDELMPTKCPHSFHPSNLQDKTSARLLMSSFHGGAESRGQRREQRVLMAPQMPHGKTHCLSMQPPPQSGVLLCAKHNHLAPHSFTRCQPLISSCRVWEDTALLFTRTSPPNSGLPCVEDTLSFTWYQPLH